MEVEGHRGGFCGVSRVTAVAPALQETQERTSKKLGNLLFTDGLRVRWQ